MSKNIIFAPGEQSAAEVSVHPSLIAFWLKTTLSVTNRRVVGNVPNTLMGVIPVGNQNISYPLSGVAGVTVNTKFHFGRFLIGVLLVIFSFVAFGSGSGGGVLFGVLLLALGVVGVLNAFAAGLEITNNGGGSQTVDVSMLDKARLREFVECVNQRLYADNDALRHQESMQAQQMFHQQSMGVQQAQLQAQLQAQQAQLQAQQFQQQPQQFQQPQQLPQQFQQPQQQLPQQFQQQGQDQQSIPPIPPAAPRQ